MAVYVAVEKYPGYLRPYLKFTLPQIELDPQEIDIWAELVKDGAPLAMALERLTMLREKRVPLSNFSIDLMALDDLDQQVAGVGSLWGGSRVTHLELYELFKLYKRPI